MTTTITDGTTSIVPDIVAGYSVDSESQNVIRPIVGQESPSVSLAVDAARSGTLQLVFADEADAWAARDLLKLAKVFTLTDTDISQIGMTFVRQGVMTLELDPDTLAAYTLAVGFQEVL